MYIKQAVYNASSMSLQSFVNEVISLDAAIKQRNNELARLREQRKQAKRRLLSIMESYNVEKIGIYTKAKLEKELNRVPKKRVPVKERRSNGIMELKKAGIPNPKEFYSQFMATQKASRATN